MKENREELNKRQKEFYDHKRKNIATRIWSYFRNGTLNRTKKTIGIEKEVLQLHTKWMGELKDKKVLDLGCYAGNSLSFHLANNSRKYVGIDLSEKGTEKLSRKLRDIAHAKVICGDFLSSEFKEENFDLIYAYGVLHHFKEVDKLIRVLKNKLSSQGRIISYDPLETSLPLKIVRTLYRPFQSDKDWEWPFSRNVYYKFSNSFNIIDRRGILGKTKWYMFLEFLPMKAGRKERILKRWHNYDWTKSRESDSIMFRCMHMTLLMEKKN